MTFSFKALLNILSDCRLLQPSGRELKNVGKKTEGKSDRLAYFFLYTLLFIVLLNCVDGSNISCNDAGNSLFVYLYIKQHSILFRISFNFKTPSLPNRGPV